MPCIAFLKAGHSVQDAGVTNAMSALGQKRTLTHIRSMSALPPKADIGTQPHHVRFVPKADSCTAAINAWLR
jgi:hypothetical protein